MVAETGVPGKNPPTCRKCIEYTSPEQGNLGAKKIASSRFQSPVKKINRKLRHWRPTARSLNTICGMVVGFTTTYAISTYHH
jgi:hypothetical protein